MAPARKMLSRRERELLAPVRNRASAHRRPTLYWQAARTAHRSGRGRNAGAFDGRVASFGFKYGLRWGRSGLRRAVPAEPVLYPELKHQTGLDEPVRSFVFKYQQTLDFVTKTEDLLSSCCPTIWTRAKQIS